MVCAGQSQRLTQFAGPGAEGPETLLAAALLHGRNAVKRFEGADQQDAVARQDIQHPVDAVVQINVGRAGRIFLTKNPAAFPGRGMAGGIVFNTVGFHLHNAPAAALPEQGGADEFRGDGEEGAVEESVAQDQGIARHGFCCFLRRSYHGSFPVRLYSRACSSWSVSCQFFLSHPKSGR